MVLAIIPAKGTSEGIPGKNIKELGGDPMIQWTIRAAQNAEAVDMVAVVTESEQLKSVARGLGAGVLDEPRFLANKNVQVDTVAYFALLQARYEFHTDPHTVIVLQPTSPFRGPTQISEAIGLYHIAREGSVAGMSSSRKFAYSSQSDGTAKPLGHDPKNRLGRQDYDTDDMLLFENGSMYIVGADDLILHRTMRLEPILPYVMSDLMSLEIDTKLDLLTAKAAIEEMELEWKL